MKLLFSHIFSSLQLKAAHADTDFLCAFYYESVLSYRGCGLWWLVPQTSPPGPHHFSALQSDFHLVSTSDSSPIDFLLTPGPALFTHGTGWKGVPGINVPFRLTIWEHPSTSDRWGWCINNLDPRPLRQVLCWLPQFPRGPGGRVELHSPTVVTVLMAHSSVTPLPSPSRFSSPLPGFSWIASQIYRTHYDLCLRVRCWGAPNQENGVSPRVALRSQNLKVSFAYDEPVFAVYFRQRLLLPQPGGASDCLSFSVILFLFHDFP